MWNPNRTLRFVLGGLLVICGAGAVLADDAEPQSTASLTLTNEHLGLGIDGLRAEGVLPGGSDARTLDLPVADTAVADRVGGTPVPEAVTDAPPVAAPPERPQARAENSPPPVSAPPPPAPVHLSFEACMERSIRAGNGYDESARVCRAVSTPPSPELGW